MAKYKIIPSSRTIVQSPISIGHKAEKGVEAIEFDLTAWVETYGSGTLTVIMRRWGDAIPYPIALEIDENNKATWTLSDIDTAKAGMAYAQLNYIVGDEVVKKSDIYTFRVMDSLTGEGEPPEAYESWLEHLTHLAAEAMAEVLDIEGIVTDKTLTVDGGIADAKAVGDELTEIKADLGDTEDDILSIKDSLVFVQGGIRSSNGGDSTSNSRIRMPKYIPANRYKYIKVGSGYKCMVFVYSNEAYTSYQGIYNGKDVGNDAIWLSGDLHLGISDGYIRVVAAKDSDANILPTESVNVIFTTFGLIKNEVETLLQPKRIGYNLATGQSINPSTGGNQENTNMVRSDYIYTPTSRLKLLMPSEILYRLFEYSDNVYTSYTSAVTDWMSGEQIITVKPNYYYRIEIKAADDGEIDIVNVYLNGAVYIYSTPSESVPDVFQLDILDEFNWSRGSIKSSDGTSTIQNYNGRLRTKLALINNSYSVKIPVEKTLVLYLYEDNSVDTFVGYVSFDGAGEVISLKDAFALYPTAKFIRFVAKYTHNMDIESVNDFLSDITLYGVQNIIHDVAETQGVANVIKRTKQLTNITFTPVADMPAQESKYQSDDYKILAGTECVGMKYSSVRVEQLYVPQAVSFQTFMTAVSNPNSYLYTRQSAVPNSKTYYGAVCSTFVAYAYGIDDVIPTTISFMTYPGFAQLPSYMQNPNSLKIGYMLNNAGSHIAIVTDILRDYKGKIVLFEISDAWHPFMRRRFLTPQQVQTGYFDIGFVAYKYDYIDAVPYTPTPWVAVDDEEQTDPSKNGNLAPRRGEDANWRASENIEIDITDAGVYTSYVVVDRNTNTVIGTHIPSGNLITLTGLSAGQYAVYLTDGTNDSESVAFNVMDTTETYETVENGAVRISYATDLGTPSAIVWCNNNATCYDYRAVRYFHVLTDSEIADGQATVNKPPISELEYQDEEYEAPNGVWEVRVIYKTEFGLYTSDGAQVNVYVS